MLIVPANYTDRLQPLDISINKMAKEFLRRQFQDWYAAKISDQMLKHGEGLSIQPVDLSLAVVKPLGARWMMKFFNYMKQNPSIIKNGFTYQGWNSTRNLLGLLTLNILCVYVAIYRLSNTLKLNIVTIWFKCMPYYIVLKSLSTVVLNSRDR